VNPKFTSIVRETWPDEARLILAIIGGDRGYAVMFASAAQRDRESYHPHDTPTLKLEALNEVLNGSGVESVAPGRGPRSPGFDYVNLGDTYMPTIVYLYDRKVWRVTSWGDMVEGGDYD
jgi:hypothetical protein